MVEVMGPWARICCATDLSPASLTAAERAVALAEQLDAELTLVHVYYPPPARPDQLTALGKDAETYREEILGRERERARAWIAPLAPISGRPIHVAILGAAAGDDLARMVVNFAEGRAYDVLVIGTHARSGLGRLVLGSVAEHIIRLARVPVLVVHPGAAGAEETAEPDPESAVAPA